MKHSRRNFLRSISVISSAAVLSPSLLGGNNTISHFPEDEKEVIRAPRLKAGDTVAITSPAGAVWDKNTIISFTKILNDFGFDVILGKTLTEKWGYFAGSDELRAQELNDFFANKKVKGIFTAKGGWGSARLLDKINFDTIKNNPKVLIGFSDITVLLNAIYAKTGLITFHGPVGNSGWNDFSSASFRKIIMQAGTGVFPPSPKEEEKFISINAGEATGRLLGGNLTVLAGIIGSEFLPDFKNNILFLEEAKEEPYSIDRMLTQLKLAGILDSISGFVFGRCAKCDAEEPHKSFTLMEVIEQHIKPLKIPAFYGAMTGHIENKLSLPVGSLVGIKAEAGEINLLRPAVT